MKPWQELKTICQLLTPVSGESHQERLENFYRSQAESYDDFRQRLLKGRAELLAHPGLANSGCWIDMGGGTGSNLELVPDLQSFSSVHVVDLAQSLLAQAHARIERRGWDHVVVHTADVTRFQAERPAHLITFSYSLSMMPNWFEAIDHALTLLAPGGQIAVVDFYVSSKFAQAPRTRHAWWTRNFWPLWFSADNVQLGGEMIEYLHYKLRPIAFKECATKIPYLRLLGEVPYYQFIGAAR